MTMKANRPTGWRFRQTQHPLLSVNKKVVVLGKMVNAATNQMKGVEEP